MWRIVPQIKKTRSGEFEVLVKGIKFRPSSETELAVNPEKRFKRINPIYTMLIGHSQLREGQNLKIVAQRRDNIWYYNLHEVERIRNIGTYWYPKYVVERDTTGSKPESIFFGVTLIQRFKNIEFVASIKQAFENELSEPVFPFELVSLSK